MDQIRGKEGVVILVCTFDMHIYTTHHLKLGMNQRREKEGVVIPTFDMHICTTHQLKLGMDQRREKEGVVIPSHLYVLHGELSDVLKCQTNQRREIEGLPLFLLRLMHITQL